MSSTHLDAITQKTAMKNEICIMRFAMITIKYFPLYVSGYQHISIFTPLQNEFYHGDFFYDSDENEY